MWIDFARGKKIGAQGVVVLKILKFVSIKSICLEFHLICDLYAGLNISHAFTF